MSQCQHINIGNIGEDIAVAFLKSLGYEILDRNWRVSDSNKDTKNMARGEIDVIARRPDETIVFCEVKTRSSKKFGDPLDAISAVKLNRINHLALAWLLLHGRWGEEYEIDAIGIVIEAQDKYRIDHRIAVVK